MMLRLFTLSACAATLLATCSTLPAQDDACCFQPACRLQSEVVMEPQTVQRFRVSYETEYMDEQVTSYRPILKNRMEEKEYRVARPVVETSYREERYNVWKPIVETSYRDESVQRTSYVTEQREREEKYTTFRPVTETRYYQQQYAAQRPVTETSYYQQQYAVQRPVTETQYQTQQYTALRPQTTYSSRTYDAGGYVAQQSMTPSQLQYAQGWARDAYPTPGPLGYFARYRRSPALYPYYTAPKIQTQYAYRPNYIQQQIAQTQLVPETKQVQVPVQVQRMKTDYMTQMVPVQRTRMETEYYTQNVPVQTTRMVPTTQVRKIPYIVQRPVSETLTRKVPVTQQRWVQEERVRKVPVRSTRLVYETRKEVVSVPYYEREAVTHTVRRPVTRKRYLPYNETVMVPRQVVQSVPLDYFDPFSASIAGGYSSMYSAPLASTYTSPVVEQPIEYGGSYSSSYGGSSILATPDVTQPSDNIVDLAAPVDDNPRTKLYGMETEFEGPAKSDDAGDLELNSPDPDDATPVEQPELEGQTTGFRIKWAPRFAREA